MLLNVIINDFENVNVIDKEPNQTKRRIQENIHIIINKKSGKEIKHLNINFVNLLEKVK